MRRSRLLPHDPLSIAAVACLIVEGELWVTSVVDSTEPDDGNHHNEDASTGGMEWMDDVHLERLGVWDSLLFSVGWRPVERFWIDVKELQQTDLEYDY